MIKTIVEHIKSHAPITDEECSFKLLTLSCQPSDTCGFNFQLGDYSLHRACRLNEGSNDAEVDLSVDGDGEHLRLVMKKE